MASDHLRAGATEVAERLTRAGYQAYLAGGCVRDLALGLEPKDYDIATDARPEQVQALFRRTVAVGIAFGVVRVLWSEDRAYEVATFRADGAYSDGRRPDEVQYATRKEDDVARRDFTINAMLMDPASGEVIDLFHGREDLSAGIIRAVGDAERRFAEDRLRMLRAVRFAARLGFTIEPGTLAAIRAHAGALRDVSVERVVQELHALWGGARAAVGHALLVDTGLLVPALGLEGLARPEHAERLARADAAMGAHGLSTGERWGLVWAATLLGAGVQAPKAAEVRLASMRLSRELIRDAQELLREIEVLSEPAAEAARRRLAAREDARRFGAWVDTLEPADGPVRARWAASREAVLAAPLPPRPLLRGHDLMALGLAAGPELKVWLERVDDAVLMRELTTADDARAWVQAQRGAPRMPVT